METKQTNSDARLDAMIAELDTMRVRAHFKLAIEAMREAFEAELARDSQAGRAFVSRVQLVAGGRPKAIPRMMMQEEAEEAMRRG